MWTAGKPAENMDTWQDAVAMTGHVYLCALCELVGQVEFNPERESNDHVPLTSNGHVSLKCVCCTPAVHHQGTVPLRVHWLSRLGCIINQTIYIIHCTPSRRSVWNSCVVVVAYRFTRPRAAGLSSAGVSPWSRSVPLAGSGHPQSTLVSTRIMAVLTGKAVWARE